MVSEEEKGKEEGNWLEEHDTIQVELLKMKDDLLKETKESKPTLTDKEEEDKLNKKMADLIPGMEEFEPEAKIEEPEKTSIPFPPVIDKPKLKSPKIDVQDQKDRSSPNNIPASPHLTNKIAKVMQLENKLKRKKFEMEKKEKLKEKEVGSKDTVIKDDSELTPVKDADEMDISHQESKQVELPPPPPIEPVVENIAPEDTQEVEDHVDIEQEVIIPEPPVEPDQEPVVEKKKKRSLKNEDDEKTNSHVLKRKRKVTNSSKEVSSPDLYQGTSFTEEVEEDENDIEVLEPIDEPEKKKGPVFRLPNLFRRRRKQ